MRVGSLFTGYGGIELGLRAAGVEVDLRWFAETDVVSKVLGDQAPNLGDVRAIDWSAVEPVDLLTAGFPCQPVSAAGRQRGDADERWLWPEVLRALVELRPSQLLIENVRNLVSLRKGELWAGILADLTGLGYDVRWLTLGACHVGAAHHRHRVFALATHGYPWEEPRVERVDTLPCGVRGDLLPTPRATDGHGRGMGAPSEVRRNSQRLAGIGNLLPTPTASEASGASPDVTREGSPDLRTAVTLLPTPTVGDSRNSRNATARRSEGQEHQHSGWTLSDVAHASAQLLPTPSASSYGNNQGGAAGRVGPVRHSLESLARVDAEHWGRFAVAVARHEAMYGPAPAPTEPNRNGAPRLAPAFAEWLMCLPAGHVTNVLDRRDALKAIGNGVCPPQLAAAWRLLAGGAV